MTSLSSGETYTYDANGNMTQRVEGGLTYTQTFRQAQCDAFDAENRLKSVTVSGQTTTFLYDGDGNLVKKNNPDGSKTIYIGGVYEVDKTSGGSTIRTVTYYPIAGAMRIDSTLYYILKDHLGSASVVTDASGNVVGENRYYPYGETRLTTGTILTDKLFTGQREMRRPEPVEGAGLGIYHYGARFYSPKLGRFLSPDSIVPNAANPQAFNRYSYVFNNPVRYADPSGNIPIDCWGDSSYCSNTTTLPGSPYPSRPPSGGDDDECDEGHCYETDNIVCPAVFDCTAEEMQEYATMFQYPGQLPWNPVQDLHTYFVFPAPQLASYFGNPFLLLSGVIYVDISDDGLSITNYSQPTHIFHNGLVERTYTQDADGAWAVTTQGTGTNVWPVIGPAIDQINDAIGAPTFDIVDFQMQIYIAVDQTLNP